MIIKQDEEQNKNTYLMKQMKNINLESPIQQQGTKTSRNNTELEIINWRKYRVQPPLFALCLGYLQGYRVLFSL
jgi:hypothetical protein